jgi:sugar/nucleoside kinase (ribokinase family)
MVTIYGILSMFFNHCMSERMSNSTLASLALRTAQLLQENGHKLDETPALIGFDGFIDTILHVVDKRHSATEYTCVETIEAFGKRILEAAGQSTNIELVIQAVKLGGNGPIMANAMAALGVPVTYCGMTGYPRTQPIFEELAARARMLPLCDAALTDAYEFEDGKLIVGKHENVGQVSWENLQERVGDLAWRTAWQSAGFAGMVNWTMLPHLTALWKEMQARLETEPAPARKVLFFDLADPEKRTPEDLEEALWTLAGFQKWHDVVLGLNEREAQQVVETLGLPGADEGLERNTSAHHQEICGFAQSVREKLGISACAVHPTAFASAADAKACAVVSGPFIAKPKITTGAGDHFNAGFCAGYLCGGDLEQALQCGVATSGYYVRHAQSPTREQLAAFLREL